MDKLEFYYVYTLNSLSDKSHFYTGITTNLENRLSKHNSGLVKHTSKYLPWRIECATAFRNKVKAHAFEKYLKSHSGRAFASKHY